MLRVYKVLLFVGLLLVCFGSLNVVLAEPHRVLPDGRLPNDVRLGPLKTLHGYFPFSPCKTKEAWGDRAEKLQRQILVATGLWPMPTKTPHNVVVHGKVERDGYTVEKVYLESFPGHFVTGNLYRPKGRKGELPAVLCPHGHWPNGRFCDAGEKKIRESIVRGAERFEVSGRYPIQARCVQLVRMGCVVFQYDMVGYADSVQLKHRDGVRERMNTAEDWGFFSPQAEARLQNMMGIQTYNSIRTLDWFVELPDVDPKRIAVTGASGGGTQTFFLCALDSRPAVAFPAVMVSTAMQGGCTCENAPYLRIGTGNIEFAAMTAPRPLGMTGADDWTKEIATKGLPELKKHYAMLGVEDRVMAKPLTHFKHNYNYVSRAVMYSWVNKHLKLGFKDPIVEEDYQPLSIAEMSVWNEKHPKPPGGDDYERSLVRWIENDTKKQLNAIRPSDEKSLKEYRRIVGGAMDVMIGRRLPKSGEVRCDARKDSEYGKWRMSKCRLKYSQKGEELPMVMLTPKKWDKKRAVVWIDKIGKQALFNDDGTPKGPIIRLLDAGVAVVGVDLIGQGEFTTDGKPQAKARLVTKLQKNRLFWASYTFGYNYSLFAKRVHDILTVVAFLKNADSSVESVDLVGAAGAGHWVAAARAQAGTVIERTAIDTAGFRFARVTMIDDPNFFPGGPKYGDLPGILALSAPNRMRLTGEGELPGIVADAYKAAGKSSNLTFDGKREPSDDAMVEWLLR